MANQRDKSKKLVGYFATPEEKAALQKLAKQQGYATLADFLRALAKGAVKLGLLVVGAWIVWPRETSAALRALLAWL